MILALLSCNALVAQQFVSASPTPDAPSSRWQAPNEYEHKADPLAGVPVVNLLSGGSLMFANLAVNNKPLTPKQKFLLAANNSISRITLIGPAAGAGISQARDTKTGYGQGAEGYFKRWAAGMAFAASSNMVGTFAIASALHEDPRYFVENSGKFRQSVRYALSRVLICQNDHGQTVTNWVGILGPLAAAGLANTYLPKDSQGAGNTFGNWGVALAISAGANIMRILAACEQETCLLMGGVDSSPGVVKPGDESTTSTQPSPKNQ